MSQSLVTMSYIAATVLFILSLSGLSNQETARRGNYYGMLGMAIAILATVLSPSIHSYVILIIALLIGGAIGAKAAMKVEMTQMPELVAIMHSLVGMAAVLVGYANFMDASSSLTGVEKTIHEVEIYVGVLIGAVTFSGSVIAFGKLSGKIDGKPMLLPARHWLNLGLLIATIFLGKLFLSQAETGGGTMPLLIMTAIALAFGVHMVMAIGGADMPVVVSMLNSYSGWAAAATGFMLSNDLLIVTGALVGSSGAILSYIMCRAMNRNFVSVIAGGFGTGSGGEAAVVEGEVSPIDAEETAQLLLASKNIMIIPGYGMAVAQAQHKVQELTKLLEERGVEVKFAIHPVAGRMPGHMNVLLAEAGVEYDKIVDLEDVNPEFPNTDVALVIGANDVVNPVARSNPDSPIYGMPILDADRARNCIVIKRGKGSGFSGIENHLFYADNTRMLYGDGQKAVAALITGVKALS